MAEASEGKVVSQRSLRRRRRELRHRAQSLVEGATDPWEEVDEYETVIPEGEEDEFIDEETAEVAEEVIEFTYTIRELGAEMILGGDCFVWIFVDRTELKVHSLYLRLTGFVYQKHGKRKNIGLDSHFSSISPLAHKKTDFVLSHLGQV